MPELATDKITETTLSSEVPQKGVECVFCNGTMYWEHKEGRECVKCKHFYPNEPEN